MSVLDRLECIEKTLELMIGRAKSDRNHVGMLHMENENQGIIISEAYVPKLRELETAIELILDFLFRKDPNYVKNCKYTPVFAGKDNGNNG